MPQSVRPIQGTPRRGKAQGQLDGEGDGEAIPRKNVSDAATLEVNGVDQDHRTAVTNVWHISNGKTMENSVFLWENHHFSWENHHF